MIEHIATWTVLALAYLRLGACRRALKRIEKRAKVIARAPAE